MARIHEILKELGLNKESSGLDLEYHVRVEQFIEIIQEEYTALEKENRELRKQTEFLDSILNFTPCTVSWVNGENLTYDGVNKVLAEACGLRPEEFTGKEVGFYTKDKFMKKFTKMIFSSPQKIFSEQVETTIEGEEKYFWLVASKYNHDRNALIIGIDITEFKILEKKFNHNEKLSLVGQLSAGIMHEINNPLNVIALTGNKLLKKWGTEKGRDEEVKALQKIEKMTGHISKIIRGLKSYTHYSDKDESQTYKLAHAIEDALQICELKLQQSRIQLEVKCPASIEAEFMVTEIVQVLVNLMTNAIDALKESEKKWMKIEVTQNAEEVQIVIFDSGPGITKENEAKVFDAFFTTKQLGKGTGLGLSICKRIIEENHFGYFDYSRDEDVTCFTLRFPKCPPISHSDKKPHSEKKSA